MSKTSIEWAAQLRPDGTTEPGYTLNPVTGCTRASAGCDKCYAVNMSKRLGLMGQEKYQGVVNDGKQHFNGVVKWHEKELRKPLGRRQPTTYFVNSMSDLFHASVPFDFIDKVFAMMAMCPQHKFLILTKRDKRMEEYFACTTPETTRTRISYEGITGHSERWNATKAARRWPLPNVGLGVSIEGPDVQDRADTLLRVPAAMRFLSLEPLIAPVQLSPDILGGYPESEEWARSGPRRPRIDWVIVGGESAQAKNTARPMHPDWVASIRNQCQAAGIDFFFKQWGNWWPISQMPSGLSDNFYVPKQPGKAAEMGEELCREIYGVRCTVETRSIYKDGTPLRLGPIDLNAPATWWNPGPAMLLFNVRKHLPDRLLDGREHNDRPSFFFDPL